VKKLLFFFSCPFSFLDGRIEPLKPSGFALLGRFANQQRRNTSPLVLTILHDSGLEDFIFRVFPSNEEKDTEEQVEGQDTSIFSERERKKGAYQIPPAKASRREERKENEKKAKKINDFKEGDLQTNHEKRKKGLLSEPLIVIRTIFYLLKNGEREGINFTREGKRRN
jgi:hypothetical protein